MRRRRAVGTLVSVLVGAALGASSVAARPTEPPPAPTVMLRVRHGAVVALHARPGGRILARVGTRTEFGSPTVLAVLGRRGRWARVSAARLGGQSAWVAIDARFAPRRTPGALEADESRRELVALRDGRVVRRFTVGVGARRSPTPTGRFQLTDKLAGRDFGRPYGCCILALSTVQPHPPPGWRGPTRMAVHGTDAPASIGRAASAGCLHARAQALRWLMAQVPLGTPVAIFR